jgi:hypothetical protein
MDEPKKLRAPDAARRMADVIALHQLALSKDELLAGRYVAIRLADGGSDGVAYDTRAAAIEAQSNAPSRCGYFQVPLERFSAATCDSLLWYVRGCYDSGFREDPSQQLIISNQVENWT